MDRTQFSRYWLIIFVFERQTIQFYQNDTFFVVVFYRVLNYVVQNELVFYPVHFQIELEILLPCDIYFYFLTVNLHVEGIYYHFYNLLRLLPFSDFFSKLIFLNFHPLYLILVIKPHKLARILYRLNIRVRFFIFLLKVLADMWSKFRYNVLKLFCDEKAAI